MSLYSFPDSLSEEAEADGVRRATSIDESNDELGSLHTVTVNPSKRLIGRKSFCSKKRKQKLYFRILLKFSEEKDKFCYDL